MSVDTAGRADNETLACCYFDPLCFLGPRSFSVSVSFCLLSANLFFILSVFLYNYFRLKPSAVSTFRPPHCDSQTPSDSHLLHHQQRRGPGRVSKKRTTKLPSLSPSFNHSRFNTAVLSNELTEDLTPCA